MLLKTNILAFGVLGVVSIALGDPPERPRYMTAAEREQMGIQAQAPTWDTARNKIDPRIYPAIQEEEEVNRKSPSPLTGEIKFDRPGGFVGEVHVLLHLRAGVTNVQSKVLSRLSAWDFQVEHIFEHQSAMTGWVGRDGLAKLKGDENVTAISFDDTRVTREQRLSSLPLTVTTQPVSKIETEVHNELQENQFVEISVYLEDQGRGESLERAIAKNEQIERQVLSRVGAEHFRLGCRIVPVPILYGLVDRQGPQQFEDNSAVKWIELTRLIKKRELGAP